MQIRTLTAAILAAFATLPAHAADDTAALRARLEVMEQQMQQLKAELVRVNAKADDANARTDALAAHQESAPAFVTQPGRTGGQPEMAAGQTSFFGYGEINYTRPRQDTAQAQAQADVRRAVIGIGHRFNDKLKLISEYEFEHAVTSKDDKGEAEVEQFYLDYKLNDRMNLKAGLFLMPIGLLNESHEPTHYYGVQRNEVETRIIPTTWREVGVGLYGTLDSGLQYDAGITTGFSIHKWDPSVGAGSPLAAVHQEGQLAAAHDLAFYGALHYVGVPGLRFGGGIWSGNSGQGNAPHLADTGTPDLSGISSRITLWNLDATYTLGNLDLRALYAQGSISQAGAINDALAVSLPALNPAQNIVTGPVPSKFDGGYVQAAYRLFERGDLALTPFVRWERYNTQQQMPAGYDADPLNNERVITAGASLFLTHNAVFKADYQKFRADPTKDRVNLGLGFAF